MRATQNTRAGASDELWQHRKRIILNFGQKLIWDACNDLHSLNGAKIAAGLQEKMQKYESSSSAWFDSLPNFHRCIQELLAVWDTVLKRAKKDSSIAVQRFLDLQDDTLVNEAELFEETAKLLRTVDTTNSDWSSMADESEVIPVIHAALSRLAELNQRHYGADGVIDVMCRVHERALLDNVPAKTMEPVVAHILEEALHAQPVLEVLFSEHEWRKIHDHVMPGKKRREASEADLEAMLLYMDKNYKRATATLIRGFELIKAMIDRPLEADDMPALGAIRSKLAGLGAIPVVVRAFSAVQDDVKGFEKPLPLHPRKLIQLGCRLLETITSSLIVHEDSVGRCEGEKITKNLLQVLDNHLGDEIIIEALLHLLIHFDPERLQGEWGSEESEGVRD